MIDEENRDDDVIDPVDDEIEIDEDDILDDVDDILEEEDLIDEDLDDLDILGDDEDIEDALDDDEIDVPVNVETIRQYRILAPINIVISGGQEQGQYTVGTIVEFPEFVGDLYVEEGRAERVQ